MPNRNIEHGSIKLPPADFTRIRNVVEAITREAPVVQARKFKLADTGITFSSEENTVNWDVEYDPSEVELAHADPVAVALFEGVRSVKWTKDTGGHSEVEDDNAEESLPSEAFGPLGALKAPWLTKPYEMADGRKVTKDDLDALGSIPSEVDEETAEAMRAVANGGSVTQVAAGKNFGNPRPFQMEQPRGHNGHEGQFTYKRAGESGVQL